MPWTPVAPREHRSGEAGDGCVHEILNVDNLISQILVSFLHVKALGIIH